MQQKFATIAGVETSAVTISLAAASLRITATIVAPSATVASAQRKLLTTLHSATAASKQLGIIVEEVPTIELAMPPPPPLTPPPPLLPPLPPLAPETDGEKVPDDLTKVPDNLEGTLIAAGIVTLMVLVACCCLLVARTRVKIAAARRNSGSLTSNPIFGAAQVCVMTGSEREARASTESAAVTNGAIKRRMKELVAADYDEFMEDRIDAAEFDRRKEAARAQATVDHRYASASAAAASTSGVSASNSDA